MQNSTKKFLITSLFAGLGCGTAYLFSGKKRDKFPYYVVGGILGGMAGYGVSKLVFDEKDDKFRLDYGSPKLDRLQYSSGKKVQTATNVSKNKIHKNRTSNNDYFSGMNPKKKKYASSEIREKYFKCIKLANRIDCSAWAFDLLDDIDFLEKIKQADSCSNWKFSGYTPGLLCGRIYNDKVNTLDEYITNIENGLKSDGFKIDCAENFLNLDNSYIVALCVKALNNNNKPYTYHFLRREKDGEWTQKEGIAASNPTSIGDELNLGDFVSGFEVVKFYRVIQRQK